MSSVKDPTPNTAAPASVALLPGLYNPLQHLVAAAELLDRQRLTPEARACARAILQSGRMLLGVMDDLRQLGSPPPPADPQPTVLSELLEEVEALWRLQSAPSAGRLLISCTMPAGVTLMLEADAAKKLLNTLIGRALTCASPGVVEVMIVLRGLTGDGNAMFDLTVSQSLPSPGPAEHDAALTLATDLSRRLGGALKRRPNSGAGETVAVDFPVQLVEAKSDDAADDKAVLPDRTHVLIVDDNATNRMVAAALCEMFGCTTQTAEDGVEAVEAARAARFDLILMDIRMPRMDGVEATRAIRRLPGALGRTPIVALTANGDAEAAKVYLANGMDAVVEKPIKPDRLLATLQAVLQPEVSRNQTLERNAG